MKLIIVAKYYPPYYKGARAIQMERVVMALQIYTNLELHIITTGQTDSIKEIDRNLTIQTFASEKKDSFLFRIIDSLFGQISMVRSNKFVNDAVKAVEDIYFANSDVILLTVSTPFDSHLVGEILKKKYPKLKWAAFLSDIWPLSLAPRPYRKLKILDFYLQLKVTKTLKRCVALIAPNNEILKICETKLKIGKDVLKFEVPHCGIFEDQTKNNKIKDYIVHSGFFSKERVFKDLFIALNNVSKVLPDFKGLIQIGMVNKKFKRYAKKSNCEHLIQYKSELNSSEAQLIQSEYFTGLIVEAKMDNSVFTPSKLAEYPFLNKKIVLITTQHSPSERIFKGKKSVFISNHNALSIEKQLIKALGEDDFMAKPNDTIEYFKPENVAMIYSHIFKQLI